MRQTFTTLRRSRRCLTMTSPNPESAGIAVRRGVGTSNHRPASRDALAVKRAQGVKLGRPSSLPEDVVERISQQGAPGKASLRLLAS